MNQAEQFELPLSEADPLEARLQRQWDQNARDQAWQWTPERMAMLWWSGAPEYGENPEGWAALPEYERARWRNCYAHERALADAREELNQSLVADGQKPLPPYRMRSAAYLGAMAEEHFQESKRLAQDWSQEIRKAFLERRPCPIKAEPAYESVLLYAFQLAQVPEDCLPQPEPEKAPRGTNPNPTPENGHTRKTELDA